MKRVRSDSEASESSSEYDGSEDSFEVDDNEQMVDDLSENIPRNKARDLVHTLAASKNILYWNSYGEMMYHQRRIPVTRMTELIEYAMLPYNLDVRPPRGLKTFTEGLAEVGVDKKLIGNKKVLADLVARQPEDKMSESDDTSSDEDNHEEVETDNDQESEIDEVSDSSDSAESLDDEPKECHVCRDFRPFYDIPVLQCPRCLWREGYYCRDNRLVECDVCNHVFAADEHTTKVKFCRCQECDAVHRVSMKSKILKLMDDPEDHQED